MNDWIQGLQPISICSPPPVVGQRPDSTGARVLSTRSASPGQTIHSHFNPKAAVKSADFTDDTDFEGFIKARFTPLPAESKFDAQTSIKTRHRSEEHTSELQS